MRTFYHRYSLPDEERQWCYYEHNHKMWLPYWGRSLPANSGVLLPSTRALGRVPLTGEVDQPRRKERALVPPEEETNEQFADLQPRCEIGKVLTAEGECRRLGEVQLEGSLLCVA